MTGAPLAIVFVIAIILLILMISKFKIHPFLSLMLIAMAFGLVGGIPLVNQGETPGIATIVGEGFASIFTSIGIVIILGGIIGLILEKTGAAFKMADAIVKVVG